MKIEKLLVLLCLVTSVQSYQGPYCAICTEHSLCKYSLEGPSPECRGYDKTTTLTNKHAQEIVKRINERRHLIAMGTLKRFPQAANMKKIRWSIKLAKFAQRWADQCDTSVKPSREDDCRDLASMQVGQNIATVLGPSPGLGVKSFVDVWSMLNLQYTGSVAYYNQSMDFKTNYFTQLIWAETSFVGCGRAKFRIDELNTTVDRLVCNFAPRGNVHGKPIYTIGYPATQCSGQMIPDIQFPGLCQTAAPAPYFIEKVTTSDSNSLLRILNLSNNSLKLELDPNNMKQINQNHSGFNDQRNQKTRQVYLNNSNGGIKRDSPHVQNSMRNLENYNEAQYTQRQFTPERGHSRMYHGFPSKESFYNNHDINHVHSESSFRRSDYTTSVPYLTNSIGDARKHYIGPVPVGPVPMGPVPMGPVPIGPMPMADSQCTRHLIPSDVHNCLPPDPPCKSKSNECTRGQARHCPPTNPCLYHARVDKVCPCNSLPPPTDPPCECMRKCPQTPGCPTFTTSHCQGNGYRKLGGDETEKSSQFDNYDLFHNLEVKSGEEYPLQKEPFQNPNTNNMEKDKFDRSEFDLYKQVKAFADESQQKQNMRNIQDSYRNFDYSERKKRDHNGQTFKPFWQMEEYNQKRPVDLKSIRYTTLSNKKKRKSRKTELTTSMPIITETITIKSKDKSSAHNNPRGRVTEKYLSFDELMHLRKLSTTETIDIDGDARRRADKHALRQEHVEGDEVATSPSTQKHCTRKLTCTWTGPMSYKGSGAGAGGAGGAADVVGGLNLYDPGLHTPYGFVEGCTRTSTCTRIYMDRNVNATTSENPNGNDSGSGTESGSAVHNDEDYCEKRSLNVRRRNLDENGVTSRSIECQPPSSDLPKLTTEVSEIIASLKTAESDTPTNDFYCICYDDVSRVKRGELNSFDDIFSKKCIRKKCNKKSKHLQDMCSDSRSNDIIAPCARNGTKSTQSWFYSAVMLNHWCMWMLYILTVKNN